MQQNRTGASTASIVSKSLFLGRGMKASGNILRKSSLCWLILMMFVC